MDPRRRFFLTGRRSAADTPAPGAHWQIHISPACLMRQHVECRSCAESCDTRALRCVPAVGGAQLRIEAGACTGCGDCVPGCPVQAITLVPPLEPASGDTARLSSDPDPAPPPPPFRT